MKMPENDSSVGSLKILSSRNLPIVVMNSHKCSGKLKVHHGRMARSKFHSQTRNNSHEIRLYRKIQRYCEKYAKSNEEAQVQRQSQFKDNQNSVLIELHPQIQMQNHGFFKFDLQHKVKSNMYHHESIARSMQPQQHQKTVSEMQFRFQTHQQQFVDSSSHSPVQNHSEKAFSSEMQQEETMESNMLPHIQMHEQESVKSEIQSEVQTYNEGTVVSNMKTEMFSQTIQSEMHYQESLAPSMQSKVPHVQTHQLGTVESDMQSEFQKHHKEAPSFEIHHKVNIKLNIDPHVQTHKQEISKSDKHSEIPISSEEILRSKMVSEVKTSPQETVKTELLSRVPMSAEKVPESKQEITEKNIFVNVPKNMTLNRYNKVKNKILKGWPHLMEKYKPFIVIWCPRELVRPDFVATVLSKYDNTVYIRDEWVSSDPSSPLLVWGGAVARLSSEELARKSAKVLMEQSRYIKALTFQDFTDCLIDAEINHPAIDDTLLSKSLTHVSANFTDKLIDQDIADCIHKRFEEIRPFKFGKCSCREMQDESVIGGDFIFITEAFIATMILNGMPLEKSLTAKKIHFVAKVEASAKVRAVLMMFNERVEFLYKNLYRS